MSSFLINVSAFDNTIESTYLSDVEDGLTSISESNMFDLIEDGYYESTILLDAWRDKNLEFTDEAVDLGPAGNTPKVEKQVKGSINRISNFFSKIINFISGLIEKFSNNITELFQNDQQWIKDKAGLLTNLPPEIQQSISIDVVPYFRRAQGAKTSAEDRMLDSGYDMIFSSNTKSIFDRILNRGNIQPSQSLTPEFMAIVRANANINGEITFEALKGDFRKLAVLFYQGGVAPATIKFQNQDAVDAIKNMVNFITKATEYSNATSNASKNVQNIMKQFQEKANNAISNQQKIREKRGGVDKKYNEEGTVFYQFDEDMYSMMEGTTLGFSDFALEGTVGASAAKDIKKRKLTRKKFSQPGKKMNFRAHAENNAEMEESIQEQKAAEACVFMCQLFGTAIGARMQVLTQISKHYRTVLGQVYDAVAQYQQGAKTNAQNTAYNDAQNKAEIDKATHERKVKEAREKKRGLFSRIFR